jgi:hypothetical protein
MKLELSDQDFKFYWINGLCHFEIGKQLKIVDRKNKFIEKSYVMFYLEK